MLLLLVRSLSCLYVFHILWLKPNTIAASWTLGNNSSHNQFSNSNDVGSSVQAIAVAVAVAVASSWELYNKLHGSNTVGTYVG